MNRSCDTVAVLSVAIILLLSLVCTSLVWADPEKQMVTICHMPGTPAQVTTEVTANAVSGHLSHGDVLSSCNDLPPGGVSAQPGGTDARVTICHKSGSPAEKTMDVTIADLDSHLGHGDLLGDCQDLPHATGPVPSGVAKNVLICHKPRTPAQRALRVSPDALEAHFGHGDALGSCQNLVGMTGARRPVIASPQASMATCQIRGWQCPSVQ